MANAPQLLAAFPSPLPLPSRPLLPCARLGLDVGGQPANEKLVLLPRGREQTFEPPTQERVLKTDDVGTPERANHFAWLAFSFLICQMGVICFYLTCDDSSELLNVKLHVGKLSSVLVLLFTYVSPLNSIPLREGLYLVHSCPQHIGTEQVLVNTG